MQLLTFKTIDFINNEKSIRKLQAPTNMLVKIAD